MNEKNLSIWTQFDRPPQSALKEIQAGRLRGKTDINPQWRYKAMTDAFGPCGTGWKWEIVRLWLEPYQDGQVCAMAQVNLYYKQGEAWSEPVPGVGGSMLVAQEKNGLYVSDEAYKMAVTDALSVSMKMLGVASAIYEGMWDGSKYRDTSEARPMQPMQPITTGQKAAGPLMVTNVTTKQGTSKQGKPYTVHTVELSDGRKATTFSDTQMAFAMTAMEAKVAVHVEVEKTAYGLNLKTIEVLSLVEPGANDDVPF